MVHLFPTCTLVVEQLQDSLEKQGLMGIYQPMAFWPPWFWAKSQERGRGNLRCKENELVRV
jgi:hypothetical protein